MIVTVDKSLSYQDIIIYCYITQSKLSLCSQMCYFVIEIPDYLITLHTVRAAESALLEKISFIKPR